MIHSFLRPGQGFQQFEVRKSYSGLSEGGRPIKKDISKTVGYIYGILSLASPKEIEMWSTTEHPISHKIVQRFSGSVVNEGDTLVLGNRFFYVNQRPRNPADLNHFIVYFCEERSGLDERRYGCY